ncbi:MAG: HAMP domain-containing sensor histidine kinase [Arcobacter sp.]|uniref:sensor histidine kinase n=1 Tax=Arcobacter sp. TaxID=1872629 RepID=UPI002A758811|nr:HAMP domain-containing sensor histidine kinase [Arcobacter sp.]MDY3200399.1 HAMP domain-containing sensor histidine kinase [Arcobacter sp.]
MKKKSKYILINFFVLIFLCFITAFGGIEFILKKEKELLEEKYNSLTINIKDKINSLILSKKNATLAITLTLSENENIKKIILNKKETNFYDLNNLSKKLKDYTDFKNVWFQIINKDGISVYRSWTENKNDEIKLYRLDLQRILEEPKIKNTISVGIYDMTFKSIVPIYKNNDFIGTLEGITHFNSITKDLKDIDKVEPIILVDKLFTEQLKQNSFSKIFFKDYYIPNVDVSKELLTYLENEDIKNFLEINNYVIKDGKIITTFKIYQDDIKLADILIFKDLNLIDISEITKFKQHAFLYLILFLILLCLTVLIISYYIYSKRLKELNEYLQQTVNNEIIKNDEKNKLLFQQNKMAAMGEMIENIAHQWRQPLSIITTSASSIKLKKEYGILEEKECEESLNYIIDTANYLSNTIDDFRYYFSPERSENLFKSKDLIDKALNIVKISFNTNEIKIIKEIEDCEVLTFENELLQVIINILNNAEDELIKKDKNFEKYIFIKLFKEKNNLKISIKDNANGINEEIIDRIFEPYFTTKHKSKGTGIGLYMCEEIIKKHMKGTISVSNERYIYNNKEYIGAMFEINIPLS